jgi:hypothetical protein
MNARKTVVTDGFLIYSFWKISFVVEHVKRKLQQDRQNLRKLKLEGASTNKRQGKFPLLGVCVAWQCITTKTKMVEELHQAYHHPTLPLNFEL